MSEYTRSFKLLTVGNGNAVAQNRKVQNRKIQNRKIVKSKNDNPKFHTTNIMKSRVRLIIIITIT